MAEQADRVEHANLANRNDKPTIIAMTVIAAAAAPLLHEGLGHGLTAWLRGDVVTELTSNHLSAMVPDRLVDAGGTIVNAVAGTLALLASKRESCAANTRYFFWLLAALNFLPAAGYFAFSGIFGFGDWQAFIQGWPHQIALRVGMTVFGIAAYVFVVQLLAVAVRPFAPDSRIYKTVGVLPYFTAGLFSCVAGAFDPLGIKLLLVSTVPAAFGGSSGLLWADHRMPRARAARTLWVARQPAWWAAAIMLGSCYIYVLGRGIEFAH